MAIYNNQNISFSLVLATFLFLAISRNVMAQNCGCQPNFCCSQFGYCGITDAYCGAGCREGPCKSGGNTGPSPSGGSVASIVTPAFFNGIIDQAGAGCAGKRFYTRNAFIRAANTFPSFGNLSNADDSKREIAAFFAHVTYETGHFCFIDEINGASRGFCDRSNTRYPCAPGKSYHGRGPLQLTWNHNYGAAGDALGLPLLSNPESVSNDPVVAFQTGLWFWMKNIRPVISQGFGATIRAINGALACNGRNPATVNVRIGYYREYCGMLGVSPGNNLSC